MEGSSDAEQMLEMTASELRAMIGEHLRERGERACEEIDFLVQSTLRQLPPDLRAMKASEAFKLYAEKDKARMHLSAHSQEAMEQKLKALEFAKEHMNMLAQEVSKANESLESLPTEQRRSLIGQLQQEFQTVSSIRVRMDAHSGGA